MRPAADPAQIDRGRAEAAHRTRVQQKRAEQREEIVELVA